MNGDWLPSLRKLSKIQSNITIANQCLQCAILNCSLHAIQLSMWLSEQTTTHPTTSIELANHLSVFPWQPFKVTGTPLNLYIIIIIMATVLANVPVKLLTKHKLIYHQC